MRNKVKKIKLINDDNEVEVTLEMINSYKINTRKRITKKGLEKYYNNLILVMESRDFIC